MLKLAPLLLLAGLSFAYPGARNCPVEDVSILANEGNPIGREKAYEGSKSILNFYIAEPSGKKHDSAILLLTDVLGLQYNLNKLIIDSFSRAGYLTVAPDMFNGTPAPADHDDPALNFTLFDFINAHGPDVTDPIVAKGVTFLQKEFGAKKIATVGYCFGGRYAFRFAAPGKGSSTVYAAHPTLLMDDEIAANIAPASIAAPDRDFLTSPQRYEAIQAGINKTNVPYELAMYGGTFHGFGVHPNTSDPKQVYGKQAAFFQAVSWLDNWA
ncbi:dienelactone hydrolase [Thozetella sp. PMI_491]|nr:dienelactone hydrolase [Thozetella sp. PMI_491]